MQTLLPLLIFFVSTVAHAAPVTWTLDEITFADGGTLEGSFVFDADTAEFSDISIESYGGGSISQYFSVINPRLYLDGSGDVSEINFSLEAQACLCAYNVNLEFASSLTNAGGNVAVVTAGEFDSYEQVQSYINPDFAQRNIVSGSVSAVPIPAAVWLFGSALAGLGWMRRKQTV